jgi:hypothetical protein
MNTGLTDSGKPNLSARFLLRSCSSGSTFSTGAVRFPLPLVTEAIVPNRSARALSRSEFYRVDSYESVEVGR